MQKRPARLDAALLETAMTTDPSIRSVSLPEQHSHFEAISRGKREWEQTFDAVSDLILIIDTHHTISRVNRSMAARCGLALPDLPGRKCYEVFHKTSHPPAFCPFVRMLTEGGEQSAVFEEASLDAFFEVTVSPLMEAGTVIGCVHVARDVTERQRHDAERVALAHQLQQAHTLESLGVLAGRIAHDFNNILTVVLGHGIGEAPELSRESCDKNRLKKIELAASRAVCRHLLAYVGKTPRVKSEINLAVLVKEVVAMLKMGMAQNVALQHDVKSDVPKVFGMRGKVQQVVMNLVMNAVEAIGDGRGVVSVELGPVVVKEGQVAYDFFGNTMAAGTYARLDVADTGCGMSAEIQARIFDPFFTTKVSGRGLGLYALLNIVKAHKGTLQLCSHPGIGTTFKVYFPADVNADAAEPTPAPEERGGVCHESAANGSVLLLQDDAELRAAVAEMLSALGYATITAHTGYAVDAYRTSPAPVDLVVIDLNLHLDGIDAYEALRKESDSVPMVISCGSEKHAVSRYIAHDECAEVISKPYTQSQLQDLLTRLQKRVKATSGNSALATALGI